MCPAVGYDNDALRVRSALAFTGQIPVSEQMAVLLSETKARPIQSQAWGKTAKTVLFLVWSWLYWDRHPSYWLALFSKSFLGPSCPTLKKW